MKKLIIDSLITRVENNLNWCQENILDKYYSGTLPEFLFPTIKEYSQLIENITPVDDKISEMIVGSMDKSTSIYYIDKIKKLCSTFYDKWITIINTIFQNNLTLSNYDYYEIQEIMLDIKELVFKMISIQHILDKILSKKNCLDFYFIEFKINPVMNKIEICSSRYRDSNLIKFQVNNFLEFISNVNNLKFDILEAIFNSSVSPIELPNIRLVETGKRDKKTNKLVLESNTDDINYIIKYLEYTDYAKNIIKLREYINSNFTGDEHTKLNDYIKTSIFKYKSIRSILQSEINIIPDFIPEII